MEEAARCISASVAGSILLMAAWAAATAAGSMPDMSMAGGPAPVESVRAAMSLGHSRRPASPMAPRPAPARGHSRHASPGGTRRPLALAALAALAALTLARPAAAFYLPGVAPVDFKTVRGEGRGNRAG
jgi:hypothetical protein